MNECFRYNRVIKEKRVPPRPRFSLMAYLSVLCLLLLPISVPYTAVYRCALPAFFSFFFRTTEWCFWGPDFELSVPRSGGRIRCRHWPQQGSLLWDPLWGLVAQTSRDPLPDSWRSEHFLRCTWLLGPGDLSHRCHSERNAFDCRQAKCRGVMFCEGISCFSPVFIYTLFFYFLL